MLERFKKYILPVLDTLSRIDTSLQILSFCGLDWKSWAIMLGTVACNFYQAPMTPAQSGITIAVTSILACAAILGIEYGRRHRTHPKPKIAEPHAFREASARLRTAFTPALAFLDKARRHGSDHERPNTSTFLRDAFESHAAAIEEFRHFVHPENREAYQKAWNEFCALTHDDGVDAEFMARDINDRDPWSVIEDKIRVILSFSEAHFATITEGSHQTVIRRGHVETKSLPESSKPSLTIEFQGRAPSFYQADYFHKEGPLGTNRGTDLYRVAIPNDSSELLQNVSVEMIEINPFRKDSGLPLPLHFMHDDSIPFRRSMDIQSGRTQFVNVISLDYSKRAFWIHHVVKEFTPFLPVGSYTLSLKVTANNANAAIKRYRAILKNDSLYMYDDTPFNRLMNEDS